MNEAFRRGTHALAAAVPFTALLSLAACGPAHPPGPPDGGHAPPPEAVEACAGKAEKDTCSIPHDDENIEGHCMKAPRGDELACMPAHGPGRPPPGGAGGPGGPPPGGPEGPPPGGPGGS